MQVAEQMSYQVPLDVVEIIIDYAAEDVTTLKNLTLTCHNFCMLGQAHIFSTVLLDGSAKRDRLIFFEDLLNGDRGQIIAGYIKQLYLLFCDDWFAEEEEEEDMKLTHELEHGETDYSEQELEQFSEFWSMAENNTSKLAFGTMIEFIAEHARLLRCIHIGPFSEIHLDWLDISHDVRNAITHLLVCAEEIALEGFVNIPITLFQTLLNVKSLDVAHIIPSLSSYAPRRPPPPSIPSPTSLAIHPGINGFSIDPEDMWDMTSFLRHMTFGTLLDFSNLTTLYLHLLDDPNKYLTIKKLLALCANSLRTLRLYIWEGHNYDNNAIDFSQLPALQSLTLVTDLSGVRSSMKYLSEAINTIGTQQLNDLRLAIDKENRLRDWTMELNRVVERNPDPWEVLLQTKISQILRESNVRIAFEFPPLPLPRPVLQPEEVFNAIDTLFNVDDMESAFKERLAFAIRDVSIKNAFTLRTEAEILSASASTPKPLLFGNSPHYEWNMFVDDTEGPVEGDDEMILE